MHAALAPSLAAAPEQPGMRRSAARRPPAPAQKPIPDVIIHPDQMPVRRGAHDDGSKFGGKLGADPLVGVDFEDPVAAAGCDPSVAPFAFALPGALDNPIGKASGDLERSIVAAVEHDDDLAGEAEAG